MTDYLELLEEGADALLEQARRLERILAAGGSTQKEGAEESFTDQEKEGAEALLLSRRELGQGAFSGTEKPGEAEGGAAPASPEATREAAGLETDEREGEGFPLLEELTRLERAAALTGSGKRAGESAPGGALTRGRRGGEDLGAWPRSAAAPLTALPGAEGGNASSLSGRQTLFSRETGWAEQADRVFRRDSRRYDGGFYLY